ncbi:MAG: DUF3187 family protein [Planctomycetota bacterium]
MTDLKLAPLALLLTAPLALTASCAGPASAPRALVRGPLPTRVSQPVALLFPGPEPRRARPEEEGVTFARAELSYASIFEVREGVGESVRFDGEIARAAFEIRRGLGHGLELSIEPAGLVAGPGFLDWTVDEFHELTGFVGGGRDDVERNQYTMDVARGGTEAYRLERDELLLADLPVTLVAALREEDEHGPAIAARFTVELPTGDEDRGSGSGGVDVAAGVLVERSVGRWTFFGGVDGVETDDPEGFEDAGIEIRTLLFANGGFEYRWSDRMSLLGQALLQMPLTRSVDAEELDREILDLGVGAAWDVGPGTSVFASFHEDAVAASGPDATIQFGIALRR